MKSVLFTPRLRHLVLSSTCALAAVLAACGGGESGTTAEVRNSDMAPQSAAGASEGAAASGTRWSAPATWGGVAPTENSDVLIPMGKTIVIDTSPPALKSLTIEGTLIFADQAVTLTAGHVLVSKGKLLIGTTEKPHQSQASIVLTGAESDASTMECGAKFLCATAGGSIEMISSSGKKQSWSKLEGDVVAGATSMRVLRTDGWDVGDKLVIAPSGYAAIEAEVVTITKISGTGVEFSPPLAFAHYGTVQNIDGRSIDQRAEVGLLTRNIVIRSAPDSVNVSAKTSAERFGGHVMIMAGASAKIDGVEFRDLGQETRLGRYPFHWHLAGDVTGQYVRNSSVHNSFTRGIVLHGSNNAVVENNVVYNTTSHAYVFAEDGSETNNKLLNNLGVLVQLLPAERRIDTRLPDPTARGYYDDRRQDEHRPSVFWGLNPDNTLEHNAAAGAMQGHGFFLTAQKGTKQEKAALSFKHNVAHSNGSFTGGNDRYPPNVRGCGLMVTTRPDRIGLEFESFLGYKNTICGAWLESSADTMRTLKNSVLADNGSGVQMFKGRVVDTLIVGQSGNTIGKRPLLGPSRVGGGVQLIGDQGGEKTMFLERVTFANENQAAIMVLEYGLLASSRVSGVKLIDTPRALLISNPKGQLLSGGFLDTDGSLSGTGTTQWVMGARALQITPSCTARPDWPGFMCPPSVMPLRLVGDLGDRTAIRSDGVSTLLGTDTNGAHGIAAYIAAGYSYQFGEGSNARNFPIGVESASGNAGESATLSFPLPASSFLVFERIDKRGTSVPDLQKPVPRVDRHADAVMTAGSYFYDASTGLAHLKVTSGSPTYWVCINAQCEK